MTTFSGFSLRNRVIANRVAQMMARLDDAAHVAPVEVELTEASSLVDLMLVRLQEAAQ